MKPYYWDTTIQYVNGRYKFAKEQKFYIENSSLVPYMVDGISPYSVFSKTYFEHYLFKVVVNLI